MTTARPRGGDGVIPPVPATSWPILVLTTTAVVALTTVLLVSSGLLNSIYNDVYHRTAGLVSRTLLFGWLQMALVLWLLTGVARLRLREVGRHSSRIGPGLLTARGIWAAGQLVQLVAVITGGGVPRLSDEWSGGGGVGTVGVLLAQLLGIAPAEETFFRGFLLVQLGAQFSRRSPAIAVGGAVVVSQLAFALFHPPTWSWVARPGSAGHRRPLPSS